MSRHAGALTLAAFLSALSFQPAHARLPAASDSSLSALERTIACIAGEAGGSVGVAALHLESGERSCASTGASS